ncbi:nucleotide-binding protein [Kluyvera ascorbata]|nr:nucleotide-binding protein [Kluyvera ascorbata]
MVLANFMRDTLSLIKKDGIRIDGIKGNVQKNKIIVHRSDISIEEGDVLVRSLPSGGIEEYVVIEPNFRQRLGGIPAGYQADVKRMSTNSTEQAISPTLEKIPESVIALLQSFISLCITIVNDDSSNPDKHKITYYPLRQEILGLENIMTIPTWIAISQTPAAVKNSVGLHVKGGNGSWERRRQYLQGELDKILSSYNTTIEAQGTLKEKNIINTEQNSGLTTMASNSVIQGKKKVFIVHGHDDDLKKDVHIFLSNEGFEPIILHLEVNEGLTIIEKLEKHTATAAYAVVLYTACDKGRAKDDKKLNNRARQNVVFEHGWLISKLTRKRVAAIVEDGVEIPGDLSGLVWISKSKWEYQLAKELRSLE